MITVPESVRAYHARQDVKMAVTLLLGLKGKAPALPRWSDVPGYYRAWLAAQQTKADFATFLERAWNGVWGAVPSGWEPRRADDPERPDLSVAVDTVWNEGCFSRRFERGGIALELSMWLEDGLRAGVVLYDARGRTMLGEADMSGWYQLDDYDTFWTEQNLAVDAETVDIAFFEPLVAQAKAVIEGLGSPRGS